MQLDVMCNLSYATTQICSCMCRMQLNFNCKKQLQNPKFLIVYQATLVFFLKISWTLLARMNSKIMHTSPPWTTFVCRSHSHFSASPIPKFGCSLKRWTPSSMVIKDRISTLVVFEVHNSLGLPKTLMSNGKCVNPSNFDSSEIK